MKIESKIRGALLGLACGDALGAPVEFMEAALVRRRYGKLRDLMAAGPWAAGEGTDETGMALATAEGLCESPDEPEVGVGKHLLEWSETAKDVPPVVRAALRRQRALNDWEAAARGTPQAQNGEAAGGSALVRCVAVAALEPEVGPRMRLTARVSALTHWSPLAEACAVLYTEWLAELLAGSPRAEAWSTAVARTRQSADSPLPDPGTPGRSVPDWFWERAAKVPELSWEELQPSGYADAGVDALEAAVWCTLYAEDSEEAIVDAVALGGATDTLGALTGAGAGACWGAEALPTRWREGLFLGLALEEAAACLLSRRARRSG